MERCRGSESSFVFSRYMLINSPNVRLMTCSTGLVDNCRWGTSILRTRGRNCSIGVPFSIREACASSGDFKAVCSNDSANDCRSIGNVHCFNPHASDNRWRLGTSPVRCEGMIGPSQRLEQRQIACSAVRLASKPPVGRCGALPTSRAGSSEHRLTDHLGYVKEAPERPARRSANKEFTFTV